MSKPTTNRLGASWRGYTGRCKIATTEDLGPLGGADDSGVFFLVKKNMVCIVNFHGE